MIISNVSCFFFLVSLNIVPPRIDYVAPPTRLDVPKGAAIKLECRATGNPPPKIVWSRKVSTILLHVHPKLFDQYMDVKGYIYINTLMTADTPILKYASSAGPPHTLHIRCNFNMTRLQNFLVS